MEILPPNRDCILMVASHYYFNPEKLQVLNDSEWHCSDMQKVTA